MRTLKGESDGIHKNYGGRSLACQIGASRVALRPQHHQIVGPLSLDYLIPQTQHHCRRIATMATSRSNGPDRSIHQDYIARIRYSNTLPPPPHPPKLLNIPNTGLSSGQYTAPGFASRLAREQPLNIEADAELGMPLDLVGMPGVFDGDESCKDTSASLIGASQC